MGDGVMGWWDGGVRVGVICKSAETFFGVGYY